MESRIIIKNPDIILKPLDSSSILNLYVLQIEDRFYKLDENIGLILLFIDKGKSLKELNEYINKIYNTDISLDKIIELVEQKLIVYNFAWFADQVKNPHAEKRKENNSYIKLKFSLFKFESLKSIISNLTFLFNSYVFYILNVISFVIFVSVIIAYNSKNILAINFSSFDYLIILLIIYIGTLWHEFGHLTASYHYGVIPKNIGFGIYIFFPVLYSDVTSIWLLDRKKRIIVNYAGIYFQLIYILILYIIAFFVGNTVILKSQYLIIISFISTLNPILRFDGYWILSDLIGIDNLRYNTQKVLEFYKNKLLKKKVIKPNVFFQYSANKILFLKSYMFIGLLFLCFFYYVVIREVWIIVRDIWFYGLDMYRTNFSDFHFNWEFVNIIIKFIIVVVVLYFIFYKKMKK
jgi:hypothetical protein